MKEKRKLKRSICYLNAIKAHTGEQIGHVNDIHHEGLNLISKDYLPLNDECSVLVETLEGERSVSMVVRGVWNRSFEEPEHFRTGCRIVNPSKESIEAINEIIEGSKKGGRRPFYNMKSLGLSKGLA